MKCPRSLVRTRGYLGALWAAALVASCNTPASTPPTRPSPAPVRAGQQPPPASKTDAPRGSPAASIGSATMAADGTITLQLRAEDGAGTVGDGLLVYKRGDSRYEEVLRHLGGLRPGESKPVPPWP